MPLAILLLSLLSGYLLVSTGSLDPSSFDHHGPDLSSTDHTAVDHTRFDHVSVDHAGLDYWPDALAHTHVDTGEQVNSVLGTIDVLTHMHACMHAFKHLSQTKHNHKFREM